MHPGFFPQGEETEERLLFAFSDKIEQGFKQKELFFQRALVGEGSKAIGMAAIKLSKTFP